MIGSTNTAPKDSCKGESNLTGLLRFVSFRSRDQATIAVLLCLSAGLMAASYLRQVTLHGGMVDIDSMTTVPYEVRLDLNRCDWPELCLLPGVSRVLARRIVSNRTQRGPFNSVDEITRVHGIGDKSLERLRPWLSVEASGHAAVTMIGAIDNFQLDE